MSRPSPHPERTSGTTPPGATTEDQAAGYVRTMFGRVAGRYDLLNHLLSFQTDRYWRAQTVRRVSPILTRPEARVMDLCCGTGDLMLALESRRGARVFGSDFCHPMLVEAGRKSAARLSRTVLFEADALSLPLPDASFDLITVAFGFRNFANYRKGLVELRRVVRPGGQLAILEFSQPPNRLFRAFYNGYSKHVLPRIGALISGSSDAYTYLPESVRKFPGPDELAAEMRQCGFGSVEYTRMTFGIVALHIGTAAD
jgi:demethylmenaquinone methyltransferase/2-methoxy-6-polyprenyl-1,4-benzoquinol methylase